MDHNHDSATHQMTCPMEGCGHRLEVHAHHDDEAVTKFMEAGKAHMMAVHADSPPMPAEAMEQMVRGAMTKTSSE